MALPLKRTGTPGVEPVSLADMKMHLNIEASFIDDDALIEGMISAARMDAEDFQGRSFITQQWFYALDFFPLFRVNDYAPSRSDYDAFGSYNFNGFRFNHSQIIAIPNPPLVSVDSLQYVDPTTLALTTIAPTAYQVDAVSEPARLAPGAGASWPIAAPVLNAVQITFTSGYTAVPFRVIQAIKLRAAAYYANREEFLAGQSTTRPEWFERMLTMDRSSIFGFVNR